MADLLERQCEQWTEKMRSTRTEDVGGETYANQLTGGYSNLLCYTRFKYGYLYVHPWVLWRARNPASMAMCIDTYDTEMASQNAQRMHRVSHHLFQASDSLRQHCEKHRDNEGTSDEPDEWLHGYETAPMDEIHAEGLHRDLSGIRSHGRASKVVHLASKLVLPQSLSLYKSLEGTEKSSFERNMLA